MPKTFMLILFFIVLAYLQPYHETPYAAFFSEWLMLFSVPIVLVVCGLRNACEFYCPRIVLLPLGLMLVVLAQVIMQYQVYVEDSVLPVGYLFLSAMAIVLGATLSAQMQGFSQLIGSIANGHVIAALLSVVLATQQWLGNEANWGALIMQMEHVDGIRPFANVAQPNQLALLCCFGIAGVLWLYQVQRLRATLALFFVLLLIWGLVLTQSRIGWVIVPLMVFVIMRVGANSGFRPIKPSLLVLFLCVYIFLVLNLPEISDALLLEIGVQSPFERMGQTGVRRTLIQQAWRISFENPWFGVGWNEFGSNQQLIAYDFNATDYARHCHNIVLNFAAELGWPVTIFLIASMGYWLLCCFFKKLQWKNSNSEMLFCFLFFTAVFVHSLVEFPLWYGYVLIPFSFLVGAVSQQQLGGNCFVITKKHCLFFSLLVLSVLLWVTHDYQKVERAFTVFGLERFGFKIQRSEISKPNFTFFPQFYDFIEIANTKAEPNMSLESIKLMERVTSRFGSEPVLMRMSAVYALNNHPEDAVKTLNILMKLHASVYPSIYQSWQQLAVSQPDNYAAVFKQLPQPVPPSQP